ncbi:MAG: hypothetical protein GVY10_00900 [Verrucomicrobia bacterium]|nr:hypothetical protein [Verrucomicrobiota bacterium]
MRIQAVSVLEQPHPELYFRDAGGEFRPFRISKGTRGGPNLMPEAPSLQLYRQSTDEEDNLVHQPVDRIPLPALESNDILMILHYGTKGGIEYTFIDDSVETYDAGEVRFQNIGQADIAIMIDGKRINLSVGGAATVTPASKKFTVQYASLTKEGQFRKAIPRLLMMPTDSTRILVIFSAHPDFTEGPKGEQQPTIRYRDYRLYDQVKAALSK